MVVNYQKASPAKETVTKSPQPKVIQFTVTED